MPRALRGHSSRLLPLLYFEDTGGGGTMSSEELSDTSAAVNAGTDALVDGTAIDHHVQTGVER